MINNLDYYTYQSRVLIDHIYFLCITFTEHICLSVYITMNV